MRDNRKKIFSLYFFFLLVFSAMIGILDVYIETDPLWYLKTPSSAFPVQQQQAKSIPNQLTMSNSIYPVDNTKHLFCVFSSESLKDVPLHFNIVYLYFNIIILSSSEYHRIILLSIAPLCSPTVTYAVPPHLLIPPVTGSFLLISYVYLVGFSSTMNGVLCTIFTSASQKMENRVPYPTTIISVSFRFITGII